MTKKTISQDDYLRLVGLLTIAADHRRILESIERSACAITGDEPGAGQHTGDAVWGGHLVTAEQLLELLDITVGQPSTTPPGPPAGAGAQAGEQVARAMGFARRIPRWTASRDQPAHHPRRAATGRVARRGELRATSTRARLTPLVSLRSAAPDRSW